MITYVAWPYLVIELVQLLMCELHLYLVFLLKQVTVTVALAV